MTYVSPTHSNSGHGDGRRDEASARNDDVFMEYGPGGRKITFLEDHGIKEGISAAQMGIGKPCDGALIDNQ